MRKKLFAVIMSVMMMVTFMPAMAFAAESHLGTDHKLSVEVIGWNADYSKANVEVCCAAEKGAVVATTSVDTTRNFKEDEGYIDVSVSKENIEKAVNTKMSGLYNGGTFATYNIDSVKVNKDAGVMYEDNARTIYYDFTDALLTDKTKTVIEEMTADQYLDLKYLSGTNNYYIRFTEPSTVDSFDKKAKYGYVSLKVAQRPGNTPDPTTFATDNAPKKDAGYNLFGYFYMNLQKLSLSADALVYEYDKNPDVRVDTELPEYTPYADGVTLDFPLQFRAYSYIEPVHVIGLSTDKTQKVKITTNSNELSLEWQILSLKESTSESNTPRKVEVASTEKEALRLGMYNEINDNTNNWIDGYYTGSDLGFEVKTQNVSVDYGVIDDMGNVSYSTTAPEVINVKTEQDGYYHDKNYHFIVKIAKGSKTVYMPVTIKLSPAKINVAFKADNFYAGIGEKLKVNNLVTYSAINGKVAEADKVALNGFVDKYVVVTGLDTSFKHDAALGLATKAMTIEETKALETELGQQFIANYSSTGKIGGILSSIADTAHLYVTDANNDITAKGIWKKSYKAKNGKLPSKKTFKLKAKTVYGNVTFHKQNGVAKIKVASNGKVTVKKGLKKGTYKVKVKMTAPCAKLTKKVTVKVK